MNITIQSIHFTANADLLDFIQKKVQKLENFNNNIMNAEVYLKLEPSGTEDNKISEIKINIPGATLFAKEQCKSFEEATDLAVESITRQIRKQKTKEQPQSVSLD
ncbi:MAG TPA: ribosome-associated translation inhibitor RaiA [Sphingobacteriaceae bacterium]